MLLELTNDQKHSYERDGFLVINDFWTPETTANLRNVALSLLDKADLTQVKSVFTTKEQTRETDEYFLTSGREIRYFWEEKAWESGQLKVPAKEAVNKIGHGLHDLIPEFEVVSYDKRIAKICRDIGFHKPLAVQSMYILKSAYFGGEVTPHQDGAFLFTEPQSVVGFWWPLDDCTVSNGCLWACPGSHKTVPVSRKFRRKDPPGEGTEFSPAEPVQWNLADGVPLEISKGSLVIIHGALVHFSRENVSGRDRHAYSVHVVEGKTGFDYPSDNWLQRPQDYPFKELYI